MNIHTLSFLLLLGPPISVAAATERVPPLPPGLSVSEGQLLLAGKPYRGMGANYFNLFYRTLLDSADTSFEEGLKQLSEAEVPFVRFMACGFWPVDWELYRQDKEAYFKRLDRIIRAAEQHQMGLIPCLFWYMPTIPDIVGEPMDQWGNPDSRTTAFMRQYTREIVLRYRNSAAIWGWEFGNEYNLHVDLPNASEHRPKVVSARKTALRRTARDELSSNAMLTAYSVFASTVRQYDKHRILITGNSIPRTSAYHNTKEHSWKSDSRNQFEQTLLRDNPDPFNVISIHVYRNSGQANTTSIAELVATLSEIAAKAKKPLFLGEFGAPKTLGPKEERARFQQLLRAVEASEVPLSAFWVFDHSQQDKDWNVTFENERSYMLRIVTDVNLRNHEGNSDP
ncbi:cellulase family glycosylhydrolase [Novipirellula artificiosorum]|uniref:Cellulase (Glycosyl hydrolase family 5) n=1 Tax=Novipirellula artificiosorum TaxID=2528016 RepID=A0A5C6D6T6_9BACT|nr:cellulase family glycosylhydrolase [Novipirellula artificiosorum]TWU30579.1 Cellulase (glycosyl hydrolase family 5) [Novipirellula artificiosorum]